MKNKKKTVILLIIIVVLLIAVISVLVIVNRNNNVSIADSKEKQTEITTMKESPSQKSAKKVTADLSSEGTIKENESSTQALAETSSSEVVTQGSDAEGVTQAATTPNIISQQNPVENQNSDVTPTPEPVPNPTPEAQPEQGGDVGQGRVELTELKKDIEKILKLEDYYDGQMMIPYMKEYLTRFFGYAEQFCNKEISPEELKNIMVNAELVYVFIYDGKKYRTRFVNDIQGIFYRADIVDVTSMSADEIAHLIYIEWIKSCYTGWEEFDFADVLQYPWFEYFKLYEENGQTYLYSTWGFLDVAQEVKE